MTLSYSTVGMLMECPQKGRWKDLGWRPIKERDEFLLGSAFHHGIEQFFKTGCNPADAATEKYRQAVERDHGWKQWFANMFATWQKDPTVTRLEPLLVEEWIEAQPFPDCKFVGKVDFYAKLDGAPVAIDWKTAGRAFNRDFYIKMSDQLTAYQYLLATRGLAVSRLGYCIVYKGDYKVEWIWFERTERQVQEFLSKVQWAYEQLQRQTQPRINNGYFCPKCEYFSLCLGRKPVDLKNISEDDF